MNQRIVLGLLAVPATVGSMLAPLLMLGTANAAEPSRLDIQNFTVQASCDAPLPSMLKDSAFKKPRGILVASSGKISENDFATNFSDAESDAAVQLFGCDCPACIRSLRQLQQQSLSQKVLGGNSQGHCLAYLQKRVSPQAVKDVLKTLNSGKTP
jgi:hypothetical protein